jgi:hypothetical protein
VFERLRKEERQRKIERDEKSRIAKEEKLKQKALQRAQLSLEKEKQNAIAETVVGTSAPQTDAIVDMSLDGGDTGEGRSNDNSGLLSAEADAELDSGSADLLLVGTINT